MSENVEYASFWLEGAQEELQRKPRSNLAHFVMENISGGKCGWEPEMEKVFSRPDGLQETLACADARNVLRTALKNSLALTERRMREDNVTPPCAPWKAMNLGFTFSLAEKVASFDPGLALIAKIELNLLSRKLGESLYSIASRAGGIYMAPDMGIDW